MSEERPSTGPRNADVAMPAKGARRLVGVDAARGLALFGMIAVHTLPLFHEGSGEPTLVWRLFGGHASALFAVLAGVSLAFTTGGRTPHTGRRRTAARYGQVGRALTIALVGFLLGFLDIPWPNILVYYGAFFLLALPFLGMRIRHLLLSSAVFAVFAPAVLQWSRDHLPEPVHVNASLLDLVTDPGTVLSELLLTGAYPALPWMSFLCAGIAIGRMNLADRRVQSGLAVLGTFLAFVTWTVSSLALRLGGLDSIAAVTPWMTADEIYEVVVYGPEQLLPTSSLWWLLVPGPHSSTPFSLLLSLGAAVGALGVFLMLARAAGKVLMPLAAMGSMTFTLYVTHLLVMWLELFWDAPYHWFWGQILVFALVAVTWQRRLGQGPLEKMVSVTSRIIVRFVMTRGADRVPRPAPWDR